MQAGQYPGISYAHISGIFFTDAFSNRVMIPISHCCFLFDSKYQVCTNLRKHMELFRRKPITELKTTYSSILKASDKSYLVSIRCLHNPPTAITDDQ